MPKRTDINSILIIGSGPIIIGQACEFDYSGTQACKALREEGYKVILVNSNPATIMTDSQTADVTYIEPITPEIIEKIIAKERPDVILPTLGGQTGLNTAMELNRLGILEKYNVEMIGARADVIDRAEARDKFKEVVANVGLESPRSESAYSLEEAKEVAFEIGFPCIVRSAFTLGGTGGGIAYNIEELEAIVKGGLQDSIISEVLIEESILGWKEYELEVMRDKNDNCVIVCAIENLDPMGVHTGDSITVAPAQTLTDRQYQHLRDAAINILREVGVETGGSNVQFAINPENGRVVVIEMNPRVSRSSALASKATGFPIAKIAAKLAVGYTLDEIENDITQKTCACFEPAIDYCVIKIPRFTFEKFPGVSDELGVSMKSVGEAMAIGRTFKEAFQKGIRSLEVKRFGFGFDGKDFGNVDKSTLISRLSKGNPDRLFYIKAALDQGVSVEEIHKHSKIDTWFLHQMKQLTDFAKTFDITSSTSIRQAKELGFSDHQLAHLSGKTELEVRQIRKQNGIIPTYKLVDTCAAEFEAVTPYFYSTYEEEDESRKTDTKKVMIIGGGPNRIGQGIEFDYCCVHAAFASQELGYESIMVNSNPETVSTDFDTSDKLFFEPLTFEDVMNIYESEKPEGVIVQFGGQTPLNLSAKLEKAGVTILGTSTESIDRAEDRERFQELLNKLNLRQPANGLATTADEAVNIANSIGYPVLVRPSYVLGGAAMRIVYEAEDLRAHISNARFFSPEHPILIDKYLENAIEVDVDGLSDGDNCRVAGVMEHIEEAGIHSGDSACVLPPYSLSKAIIEEIETATKKLAKELNVIGLLNIQFAVKNDEVYVIEVNPRGSRTVPFVSKATGIPWAKLATRVILGEKIANMNITKNNERQIAVKEAVFPFNRFPGVDILLGPEMKSTGEVMGLDHTFEGAFLKSQLAASQLIPQRGKVFITVRDADKEKILPHAKIIQSAGFEIIATAGTAALLNSHGIKAESIYKLGEGRPHIIDYIKNKDMQLIFNTPEGEAPLKDEIAIRQEALRNKIPVVTTVSGIIAMCGALHQYKNHELNIISLQELYSEKGSKHVTSKTS